MASHIEFLTSIFFVIIVLFSIFYAFRIVRFVMNLIRYLLLTKKYRPDLTHVKDQDKFHNPLNFSRNDFKARDRKTEQAKAVEKVEKVTDLALSEETKIVGIAEPIGRWTKFVTNQKISWLQAMVGTKTESDQFWQNMIKAQQRAASKFKGRVGPGM